MRKLIAAAIFLAFAVHGDANAETYPSRPITLVVPFANGGGSDIIARIVAKAMQSKLGQPVIVENTDGAGGMVGTNRVVKAAPDGYTFLFAQSGITASTTNNPRQIYLISSSLKPIGLVANEPYLIIARNNLPAKGLNELVHGSRKISGMRRVVWPLGPTATSLASCSRKQPVPSSGS